MIREEEESGLDLDWFALDSRGAVGHLTTGGCGALPRSVAASRIDLDTVADYMESLPEIGAAVLNPDRVRAIRLHPFVKKVEPHQTLRSWVASAARGLHAFDYIEDRRRRPRPYWIIARPEVALHADELPADVRAIVARTTLRGVDFARDDVIGVASLL